MSLAELRKQIDALDEKLIELLNERVRVALEIGKTKKEQGGEIYVPSREKAVFDRIAALNRGPLPEESARAIYREIMSAALALESNLKIACLGPSGTFPQQAAYAKFGASVDYHPVAAITAVFDAVEQGIADYGVVPVENAAAAVSQTLDRLATTPLKICAEICTDGMADRNAPDAVGTTRFLVIGKKYSEPTGNDKTSICFEINQDAGTLNDALAGLKAAGVNVTRTESRPDPNTVRESCYFIDFEGHADHPHVQAALVGLEKRCAMLKVLGSYPKGETESLTR